MWRILTLAIPATLAIQVASTPATASSDNLEGLWNVPLEKYIGGTDLFSEMESFSLTPDELNQGLQDSDQSKEWQLRTCDEPFQECDESGYRVPGQTDYKGTNRMQAPSS